MPVYFNSNNIIPGPFVTINKETDRSEDGQPKKVTYVITLKGSLSAYKGSPNSQGIFWTGSGYPPDENINSNSRLSALIAKQGALTNLFSQENGLLEVQAFDGSAPLKAVVRLRNISFDEGKWVEVCNYSITFEASKIYYGNIESYSLTASVPEETWSIEQTDDKGLSFRATHSLSCTARTNRDLNGNVIRYGWQIAKDTIHATTPKRFLGLDSSVYADPNAIPLSTTNGYNYVRGESIDESNGKYTVTESWTLYDTSITGGVPCLEEYNISFRTDENGRIKGTIEGTLTGLNNKDNLTYNLITSKYTNASTRWAALEPQLATICQNNAPVTLNPTPLSQVVGKNKFTGVITFSREFDNRPVLGFGAISYTIQISNKNPNDIFASMVVLGKTQGPVLQSIYTVTASERRISIEVVLPVATINSPAPAAPSNSILDAIINSYKPNGVVFKNQDEDSWAPEAGRYSRNVAWTFTP